LVYKHAISTIVPAKNVSTYKIQQEGEDWALSTFKRA
jgi:hypothetical protein